QVQPGVTARIRYEYLGAGWGYQVSVVAPARPLTVPVDLVGTDPVEQRVRRDDSRQKVLFALGFPPTAWKPVRPRLAEDDQYAASIEKTTRPGVGAPRARHRQRTAGRAAGYRPRARGAASRVRRARQNR